MLEAPLYSAAGARAQSAVTLPVDYFDGTVHEPALHQAVTTFLANQRQGTAATKNRKLVSGGNQKPWRQKGTGRARQGSIRAPHWRGGGVVFGPTPRDYRLGLPAKVRRLARRSALNARAREGALYVVEGLAFEAPRTRHLVELLARLGLEGKKTLLLTDGAKRNVYLSGRNLPETLVLPYAQATAYEVLWSDVVVVERPALGTVEPAAQGAARKPARAKATGAKAAGTPKRGGKSPSTPPKSARSRKKERE
jgi:large subunit ribosomal protein L4